MSNLKNCSVIMLPTNDITADFCFYINSEELSVNTDILAPHTNQHLYVLSNEELTEKDIDQYVISTFDNWQVKGPDKLKSIEIGRLLEINNDDNSFVMQTLDGEKSFWDKGYTKKILGTTDFLLGIDKESPSDLDTSPVMQSNGEYKYFRGLPRLPKWFIKEYVDSFNQKNVLKEVFVNIGNYSEEYSLILSLQESKFYTKEEVLILMNKSYDAGYEAGYYKKDFSVRQDWFSKNNF